jgi:microcystin-dependent protein
MSSRRIFLFECSTALAALALAPISSLGLSAISHGDTLSLERMSYSALSAQVNTPFLVRLSPSSAVELTLLKAPRARPFRSRPGRRPPGDAGHEKFSLIFDGPKEALLASARDRNFPARNPNLKKQSNRDKIMASPFIGEITLFAGNFAPRNWAFCNGQILPISQNTALFSILGTTYGGNGQTTFALPDLRGRVPIHQGQGPGLSFYNLGQMGGSENVTLLTNQLPAHNHAINAVANGGDQANPIGNLPAVESTGTSKDYSSVAATGQMAPGMVANTGGGQPVPVVQPYGCVSYIIALYGIFPSRN